MRTNRTSAIVKVDQVRCELDADNILPNWTVEIISDGWVVLLCNCAQLEFAELIKTALMIYFDLGGDITPVLKAGNNARRVKP